MIKFTKLEDDCQFISITINKAKDIPNIVDTLIEHLASVYPNIKEEVYDTSDNEILLNLEITPTGGRSYNLKGLTKTVNQFVDTDVYHFAVDMDYPKQRVFIHRAKL